MSVRELVFDIGFKGDSTALLKADQAADSFKTSVGKIGTAADDAVGKATKGFGKIGDSISQSNKETVSFTQGLKDIASKSNIIQNLQKIGESAKTHVGSAAKNAFSSMKTHIEKNSAAAKKLSGDLDNVSKKLDSVSQKSGKIGNSLTTKVTLPLIAAGGAAFKFASDLQENMGKTEQVFQDQSDTVLSWSKSSLKNFGMARSTALDMASLYGDMGTGMGMGIKEAADMSMSLTGLAADISSFKNVGLEQSQSALKGIYTGETESLKNLGIVMTETNLAEYALSQGIRKKVADMTQAEKVQLRYNYVIDKTKNAQGDFARTGGNAANQTRVFFEGIKELATGFGNLLLPVITPMIQKANDFIVKLQEMDDKQRSTILKFGAFAIAAGPMIKIFSVAALGLSKLSKGLSIVKGLGVVGMFSKIGAGFSLASSTMIPLIAVIGGLVLGGYLLYKNWDMVKTKGLEFVSALQGKFASFLPAIQSTWNNLKIIFTALLPVFSGVLSGIGSMLGGFIMTAATLVGNIITVFSGITDFLVGVFTGNWGQAWTGIKQIFSGTFQGIKTIFKGTINFLTRGLNSFISGINGIKVPKWVPGLGGKNISIPLIPQFAKGVDNFGGGLAIVGEKGPELVNLPTGSSVTSNSKTERMLTSNAGSLSDAAYAAPSAGSNYKRSTYVFSPKVEIHTSSDRPGEVAEVTKNKMKEWFEEWIDDADIA